MGRIVSILLFFGVLLSSFPVLGGEETLKIGVVHMEEVKKAHPLFEWPKRMEEELHYFYRQIQEEKKSYERVLQELTSQREDLERKKLDRLNRIQEEFARQKEEEQRAMEAKIEDLRKKAFMEFQKDVEAEKKVFNQGAEERISAYLLKEEKEFQEYLQDLLEEYKPLILNLRLKLLVLNLLPEKEEDLKEEISSLEEDLAKKIHLRKEELEAVVAQYRSFVEGQVQASLKDYEERRQREVQEYLRIQERRLHQELEDRIQRIHRQLQLELARERERQVEEEDLRLQDLEGTILGEIEGRILFLEKEIVRLEESKASIYQEMEVEIWEVIRVISQDQGLDLVLQDYLFSIDALDITKMVVNKLQ